MILLAYYDGDPVGHNTAEWLRSYDDVIGGNHDYQMVQLDEAPIYTDGGKLSGSDLVVFISKHSSAKGVSSFTVHSCGNWGTSADLGGLPKNLCRSDPIAMWKMLVSLKKENTYDDVAVTYEATHHGPSIDVPCMFVEVGGNEAALNNKGYANVLARAIRRSITDVDTDAGKPKIAIGIGGMHYPEKFTRLALEGKMAFSYIMSRYNIGNVDMIERAVNMSTIRPEVAAIEWKSLKAGEREAALGALDAIGLQYERI